MLTNLSVVGDTDEVCLSGLIVSDPAGNQYAAEVIDCTTIVIDEIETCEDDNACNTGDDGACEYPEDNFDCDGNCTVEEDCNGDCGGDAVVDDCGVCDGPGYSYCWNGDAVCDLADCPDQPSETVAIFFESDSDIAGFQFNLDNVSILNAGGGAAADAGFTLSNSSSTVIGFSLTGNTIPAGGGLLVQVEVQSNAADACLSDLVFSDSNGAALPADAVSCTEVVIDAIDDNVYGCTDESACNFDSDATADDGSCDYGDYCWDGSQVCDLADCPDQPGGDVAIYYNTDSAIAGFQFNVEGVDVTGASGGAAEAAGFTVSTSSSVVIGFSLTGSTIPAGEGVLTNLSVVGETSDACLADLIVSDPAGDAYGATVVDCTTIVIDEIATCDDDNACNTGDDGACEYPEDNFDCDGNCTVEEDLSLIHI